MLTSDQSWGLEYQQWMWSWFNSWGILVIGVLILILAWWWLGKPTQAPCSVSNPSTEPPLVPLPPPLEPVREPVPEPVREPLTPDLEAVYECRPHRSASSRGESVCRSHLEHRFGVEFPTCRPKFLKNPETNEYLELDCYNQQLRLAVEYQGPQHYKWPNYLGSRQTLGDFMAQLRRDKFKVAMCDHVGVYVIRVPYTIKFKDIPAYIEARLPEHLAKLPYAVPVPVTPVGSTPARSVVRT